MIDCAAQHERQGWDKALKAMRAEGNDKLLALVFIPAAGLLWMVWHILVGWQLAGLGRREAA